MNAFRQIIRKWTGKPVNVQQTDFSAYIGALVISKDWGIGVVKELDTVDGATWVTAQYIDKPTMRFNMPAIDCELIAMFPVLEV